MISLFVLAPEKLLHDFYTIFKLNPLMILKICLSQFSLACRLVKLLIIDKTILKHQNVRLALLFISFFNHSIAQAT